MNKSDWTLEGCEIADVYSVVDPEDNPGVFCLEYRKLRCPLCSNTYQHPKAAQAISGHDSYEAGWGGRGELMLLPFWGECGHRWELCFGFHKGETFSFVRVPSNQNEGEAP